jgi:hypothetical protein
MVIRARGGISSSGQRSCRCQRRSLISAVRWATSRSRWSTSRRTSSSGPASCATGKQSRPSRSAARAIATASRTSDLPAHARGRARARSAWGDAHDSFAAASRNRSSAPETCRESSIAHTHSPRWARAHVSKASKERSWGSAPITITALTAVGIAVDRIAGGHFSVRDENKLLWRHAGDPRTAAGDTTSAGQTSRSTESQSVSPSPARGLPAAPDATARRRELWHWLAVRSGDAAGRARSRAAARAVGRRRVSAQVEEMGGYSTAETGLEYPSTS